MSQTINEQSEFKAGDEVSPNFYENLPDDMWITCDPYFFVGKTRDGKFCVETRSGNIHVVYGVRKPDPDKLLREIAKELTEKYVKGTASSGKGGVFSPYKISEYIFEDNGLEQMLIEMGKRIESLKKGKNL